MGKGIGIFRELAARKLSTIEAQGRLRTLRQLPPARSTLPAILDLTHNDYLGFRYDAAFQERAMSAAKLWPMGAGASRLLGGEHSIYAELENAFSEWKGAEASLYFASGYAANETLMSVLSLFDVDFFSDQLNHASLIDGMKLARLDADSKKIFRHNDLNDLAMQLQRSKKIAKVVITESLFSMDGDQAPLVGLLEVCEAYGAVLVVDEAHALGVYGENGSGLVEAQGLNSKSLITINPCGKAMAACGALVSGPEWLRQLIINTGRGFIYSTGASPWIAAGILSNLPTVRESRARRNHLANLATIVREELILMGYSIGNSSTHIIPVILGSEERSLKAERALAQRNILARAIRPPTVAEGSCRLRLSLHAGLQSVAPLLAALKEIS